MTTPSAPKPVPSPEQLRLSGQRRRRLSSVALAVALLTAPVGMAACSSDGGSRGDAAAAVASGAVLVDVRTPSEFAAGHLDGAVNIDVQSPDFSQRIAALDPTATYLVYCRSGNRSAQAVSSMRAAGFTDLSDLGSVQEAADATGVAVVR
jgi:phage shock protein E